ncbi:MAG TPA: sialidase family protein [Rhizomicrobium sp.]|nr:sialidase family protein [Rhizomicrobium sp.]
MPLGAVSCWRSSRTAARCPIYRSTDNGETWTQFSDEDGRIPAGAILAAGTGAPGADPSKRTLEVSVSTDGGKTWGKLVYDVAIADGLTRPGMTVVTRDGKANIT